MINVVTVFNFNLESHFDYQRIVNLSCAIALLLFQRTVFVKPYITS